MSDAFLAAHWTGARTYDISAEVSPVSIRDQMMRGRLFAERAVAEQLIAQHPDEGLVVVGAGAAGMTAAITAAQLGVPTLVLESSAQLFRTQANCRTRWIDPTQYDWPRDHWPNGHCPHRGSAMPLPWQAGPANVVASSWFVAVQSAMGPLLKVVLSIKALGLDRNSPDFVVQYRDERAQTRRQPCGALLLAAGFGAEDVEMDPQFRGYAFWDTDPFGDGTLKGNPLNPRDPGPQILISGGGDGALQDYLRLMTQKASAREVLEHCGLSDTLPQQLKDLDRAVNSAYVWSNPTVDHSWHDLLDRECRALARSELQPAAVQDRLAHLLAARPRQLQLIHGCTHLTPFYLLNRFLTWLIEEYLRHTREPNSLVGQTRMVSVASATFKHQCKRNPTDCHGTTHNVGMVSHPDCRAPASSTINHSNWDFIIVRHGIARGRKPLKALRRLRMRRQVLPDFLP